MRIFLRDNMYERNWGRKDKNKTEREKYKIHFKLTHPTPEMVVLMGQEIL